MKNLSRLSANVRMHLATGTVVLLLVHPWDAVGVGFRLPNQDPEAIARGNAFVATADNPSAIYYNPAGITQLEGQNLRGGLYLVSGGIDYESPSGAKANIASEFKPVPQFYYVASPKSLPVSLGLGVYAPYGLSLDWGQNSPLNTLVQKGDLLYLTFNPVAAVKLGPRLSIGMGPTINYSSASIERAIGLFPGDKFKLEGDGMDYGFNAGLLWQPNDYWSFGFNYRSQTIVNYEGTSRTSPSPPFPGATTATAPIHFPQFVVIGVSFRPTEKWNLEFDLDWTDWSEVQDITIKGTAFGTQFLPLHYRSSFMYEFGITRQLENGYFVSLGYFFSENSSPDANFTPLIPDSELHLGGIGLGHKGEHWGWAVAYQFGYNPERIVSNDQTYPLANGTYHILNHAVNFAVNYRF